MRRCAICNEEIPKGWQYFYATITDEAAAKLVDYEVPALTPAMHRVSIGMRLNFCTTCAGELVDVSMLTGAVA